VVGQQLSVTATRMIVSRVQERFGGRMPSPRELLAADPMELRASGMSNRKAATLRALAERFLDGRLDEESLTRMSDDEVEAALTEVPGIGPWTAHGFLIVALDRPDVLLSGHVALRRAVRNVYGFDHLPSENEMAQLAQRWRPYRSLAVSYLFSSDAREEPDGARGTRSPSRIQSLVRHLKISAPGRQCAVPIGSSRAMIAARRSRTALTGTRSVSLISAGG